MLWLFLGTVLLIVLAALAVNAWVLRRGRPFIVPAERAEPAQTAIVLGAYVYGKNNLLCTALQDRVDTAIDLYHAGRVQTLLMSGDHGQPDYDEVNAMRLYAEKRGVPPEKIFLDHAGFNTYDSMTRARQVFQVESAIVVTNGFHLPRAVFLAESQGIRTQGVVADRHRYSDAAAYEGREFLARIKAFLNVYLLRPGPALGGEPVPITGDARVSHDQ